MTAKPPSKSETLNPSQRKALGISAYAPRERRKNEALPITFVQSELNTLPRMESTRPGANDHLNIGRVGVYC